VPNNTQLRNTTFSIPAQTPKAPRTPAEATPQSAVGLINLNGYGGRSLWTYPPIGESAQRDPHVPDPTPGLDRQPQSQATASPPVGQVKYASGHLGVGEGASYTGFAPAITYIKRIGSLVTRSLARNYLSGVTETKWRVGGVSYPFDYGYGPGYMGDAQTLWLDEPQAYLRNPGIRPLAAAPATYRIAPGIGGERFGAYAWLQNVGPAIGDVGNSIPIGQRMPLVGQ